MIELIDGSDGPGEDWVRITPDLTTFNNVIDALSSAEKLNSGVNNIKICKLVLTDMRALGLEPNVRTYNSVINIYAKSNASGNDNHIPYVMSILDELQSKYEETLEDRFKPDVTTYTSVIDCIAHAASPHKKGSLALEILDRMESLYNKTLDITIQPNIRTYTAVLNSLARSYTSNCIPTAVEIFRRIEEREDLKANMWTYTALINTWAHSHDKTKAQQGLRLLKKLSDEHKVSQEDALRPTLYTYNAVINCCAQSYRHQTDVTNDADYADVQAYALKIAFAVFKALRQNERENPNHVTFNLLLKASKNLIPEGKERDEVVIAIFDSCIKAGQVEASVIKHLKLAGGWSAVSTLLEVKGKSAKSQKTFYGGADEIKLPDEWTKNIKQ